jgi:hypothetical protein
MPRWTISVPASKPISRYLPRRPCAVMRWPTSIGQVGREGPAQAFAPEHDLFDDAAFQVRCDAAPGHFYFGEFRHENLTKFL